MIVPLTTPDGKAVIPVDFIVRQAYRQYEGWKEQDFKEYDWNSSCSESVWEDVLFNLTWAEQAADFKRKYLPTLEKLKVSSCWRLWMEDTTPVWMTGILEYEPFRENMTPEEKRLAVIADAGGLHPCIPWFSRKTVWFPIPQKNDVIQWGRNRGLYIPVIHPSTGEKIICISINNIRKARKAIGRHLFFIK